MAIRSNWRSGSSGNHESGRRVHGQRRVHETRSTELTRRVEAKPHERKTRWRSDRTGEAVLAEIMSQGVEFMASDVYTKHVLRNLRGELKRSRMKGKPDGDQIELAKRF